MKWLLKIIIKIFLSKFPIPYSFWKAIGFFKHGRMDSSDYAIKIFNIHFSRAFPKKIPDDLFLLEIGPGDSIASAIIGKSYGVKKTFLVDVDNFATENIKFYKRLSIKLKSMGLDGPDLSSVSTIKDILKIVNGIYLSNGLSSFRSIKSNSVDFIWSHSVMEHVRKKDFIDVQKELKRILKPTGFISHNIDFQDHLDHSLNNLRFSERIWESDLFVKAGFYTNRIPAIEMHSIFRKVGFKIEQETFGKWPKLPIPRIKIHKTFKIYKDSELINRTSSVLMKL